MFLTRWLEKLGRTKARRRTTRYVPESKPAFRPGLEALGDRLAPHAGGFLFNTPAPFEAPWALIGSASLGSAADVTATQFAVRVTRQAYAGAEAQVTVVALDANNRVDRDYTGTVALTSSDAAATLPDEYTFTAADHGRHTFTVTLATTGDQTVTATDTADGKLTGEAAVSVVDAPVATHFFVLTERDVYTGTPTRVLVAALDASNRPVSAYTGTVHLSSTDTGATLPADYTFTAADHGVHVFTVTPSADGEQTITATDTATASLTGSVTVTAEAAPVATHFALVARPRAATGVETQFYIVALDDNDQVVRNFTGTVTITSTDASATLPASYTFTAADRGVQAIEATFATTGEQTVTVTSDADSSVTGTVTIDVGDSAGFPGFGHGGGFFGGRRPHGRR